MNMRKIIAVLAAALMLCAIIPMGAISVSAASAVYSEDFEDGTTGGWTSNCSVASSSEFPVANAAAGNYALKFVSTNYSYTNRVITVEKNTTYRVTFSILSGEKDKPVNVRIRTNGSVDLALNQYPGSTTAWETHSIVFNSGNNTSLNFRFQSGHTTCTYYIDNLSVETFDGSIKDDGYLQNGDFETGAADNWYTAADASIVDDPTGAGQGKVLMTNEDEKVNMFSQSINITNGTQYVLSFKVYGFSTISSNNSAFYVRLGAPSATTVNTADITHTLYGLQDVSDTWTRQIRMNMNTKTGAWQTVSIPFTATTTNSIQFAIYNYRENAGQYYFDDFKIREAKEASFDGYITNGDFETGNASGWTVGSAAVAEDGNGYILKGTATKKYGNFVHQIVTVEPNTEYAISFKAKAAVSGGIARVYAGTGTGNTGYKNTTYSWSPKTDVWTTYTVSFNSGSDTQIYINLCQGLDNGGDIYYDDVLMWEIADPSFDGYLYNGDFETGVNGAWNVNSTTAIDTASKHTGNFGAHLSVSSAGWGGMLNQTITGLEPGATYSITFWYKVIQQGVNWKVEGETIGDNGKAVSLVANYVTTKEWTQVTKEFVADGTTARVNFSGSGITEDKSSYEAGIDEMYVDDIVITKLTPAHTHEYVGVQTKAPSCTEAGVMTYSCTCGEGTYTESIDALGHTAGAAADCDSAQVCTVCGIELAPALGHTAGAEADCDSAQVCTVCGIELNPALGHTAGAEADCDSAQVCTVCGIELAPALGHTAGAEADCENAQVCTVCGAELNAAIGHAYAGEQTKAPTCGEAGVMTYTCANCGDSYTEEIAATGEHVYFYPCDPVCMNCYEITNPNAAHTIVAVEAVEATCTANGNIAYWYCSDCGAAWADEALTQMTNRFNVVVPATGEHTYDNDFDTDCNICDAVRSVAGPVSYVGKSVSEDVSGLAMLFNAEIEGIVVKEGTFVQADFTNATYNGYKLLGLGVKASNGVSETDIEGLRMYDLEDGNAKFAFRVINIPADKLDVEITMTPYYIVEIDGVATTIYGAPQTGSYAEVAG